MRPRPDAAENADREHERGSGGGRFNEAAARCRGKRRSLLQTLPAARAASMRPRPDAAENDTAPLDDLQEGLQASMRPRARCRGKRRSCSAVTTRWRGFNEAAARCRGKRRHGMFRAGQLSMLQ